MSAHQSSTLPQYPERATLEGKNKFLGLWFFLAGETALFATLFGVYLGLRNSNAGGPTAQELFSLPLVFLMTIILLVSSMTSVLAIMAMRRKDMKGVLRWFIVTVILGLSFLGLEIYEFIEYTHAGHQFTKSAFASAFYTLLGTHGAHVAFGCGWITTLVIRNFNRPLDTYIAPKFYLASLYWHFIDVVWIFIFSLVYLLGVIG